MSRITDLDDFLEDNEPTLEEILATLKDVRKEIAEEQHPPQQFRDRGNGE